MNLSELETELQVREDKYSTCTQNGIRIRSKYVGQRQQTGYDEAPSISERVLLISIMLQNLDYYALKMNSKSKYDTVLR